MKKTTIVTILLMTLCMLTASTAPSWAREKVNVAMVLWRGMTDAEKGFQDRLKSSEKYDIEFTVYDANQSNEELDRIIDQLDTKKFRLIYSFGTTVTKSLKSKITDVPIVFNIVSRPVKANVIDSWEHSGSNVTGASNAVPMGSAFSTLSKVLYIGRLGFLFNPKEANSVIQRDEVSSLQETFGYELIEAPVESEDQINNAIRSLVDAKVDAVLLPQDSFVKASADKIIPLLNEFKIPSIVTIPVMVRDNKAFLGLGANYYDLGNMAGDKALEIFDGKAPNDVPSSTLSKLHMTVNLSTAREIGVNVPVQILRISTVVR